MHTLPAVAKQGDTLPSYFSSYTITRVLFTISAMFFACVCFIWLVILLSGMAPKYNVEVPFCSPSAIRLWYTTRRKYVCWPLQAWVMCCWPWPKCIDSKTYLNKVTFSRSIYETVTYWLADDNSRISASWEFDWYLL